MLTNLFWTQRAADGSWTLQFGQIDATDFVDIYGAVSPYTAFQNLAFNTNPTINTPNPGVGIVGGARWAETFMSSAVSPMPMLISAVQIWTFSAMVISSKDLSLATHRGLTGSIWTIFI
nr:carbohydrate porin [uncultured Ruegeria sp.]